MTSFETALKKGELGEKIIRERLEKAGWIVYFPFTKHKPHYFDMLATMEKEKVIAIDVKTKARLNMMPAQGINKKQYDQYMRFAKATNVPFWIVFVDEMTGDVHTAELVKLENPIFLCDGKIIAWRLAAMEKIMELTESQKKLLQSYNQRSYEFAKKVDA